MVKSPQENGNGTTAADCTAMAGGATGARMGEPTIVAGPGFGLAGRI
jgi:hypothetical protein